MNFTNCDLPNKHRELHPDEVLNFLQGHLDRVSRSFAFCIKELEGKFRFQISLCYLLFRVLDTVEDAQWSSPVIQELAFKRFNDFVVRLPDGVQLAQWISDFPETISAGERSLLNDSGVLFALLHEESSEIKIIINNSLRSMARGMLYFCQYNGVAKAEKSLVLNSIFEVNRYCFFVAGIVGEMLEQLFHMNEEQNCVKSAQHKISAKRRLESFHFGLFLQKINVLKDQLGDQKEGRFLVPDREALLLSLKVNAYQAFEYLISIPIHATSYRLFCAWSLYLGLSSLPYIEEGYTNGYSRKMPRLKAFAIFQKVRGIIGDNDALEMLFSKAIGEVKWPSGWSEPSDVVHSVLKTRLSKQEGSEAIESAQFLDFEKLYHGELSAVFQKDLGLIP